MVKVSKPKPYACVGCGVTVVGTRLPMGWKDAKEGSLCKACFGKRYECRAVTIPVGSPVGSSWELLRAALKKSWDDSTDLANWCVTTLFRLDAPGQKKIPDAVKKWYGYGECLTHYPRLASWEGAKASLAIIVRAAHEKYKSERYQVMVMGNHDLLKYRYPYPFPVDADNWKADYEPGQFPAVALNLPGAGKWRLRLKHRDGLQRQLARYRQLFDGDAIKGEAALFENRKGDVMVKLVGHFPKRARDTTATRAALIHTDPGAFLVVDIAGSRQWIINGDHLRRLQAIHRTYRQRMSEDAKREKRLSAAQRANLNGARAERCDKHNRRIGTAIHEISAQVARYCQRQRVGLVFFDDAVKSYIPDGFPWHQLREKLAYKLDALGVEWLAEKPAGGTDEVIIAQKPEVEEDGQWQSRAASTAEAGRRAVANVRRKGSHPSISTYPAPTSKPASARE